MDLVTTWTKALVWLAALLIPASAWAQTAAPGPFGLGIIIGAPTGLSLKARLTETASIDGAIGLGIGADLHIHGDYIFEGLPVILTDADSGLTLDWFVGVGGRMLLNDDDNNSNDRNDDELELGPRAPIGLQLYMSSVRNMELFAEVAIGLDLVDERDITVDGGIGFRWFF